MATFNSPSKDNSTIVNQPTGPASLTWDASTPQTWDSDPQATWNNPNFSWVANSKDSSTVTNPTKN